ncbi:MAG TPA: rhodanese-like domain-containing protein [Caulifigura sp.]|jgi:rhodanese-related sulfurtransferase|nr:rhodanese-like domain-containing protein [Caulifigura sp.]
MPTPIEIDVTTTKSRLDAGEDLFFVDCREPDEHTTAHIKGATLIPMSRLADRIAEFQPHAQKPIVIHCHHGGRSLRVAMWLRQQGYPQAQSMAGGIDEWAQKIDPAVPRY